MRTLITILTLGTALAGSLAAQTTTLVFQTQNSFVNKRAWYENLTVTNPQGILVQRIYLQTVAGLPSDCSIYLRQSAALPQNRTSASGWTLHDTVTVPANTHWFDFENFYLPPGTYGIALVRSDTQQAFASGLPSVTNSDLTITGVGATSQAFTAPASDLTAVCGVEYSVGPVRSVLAGVFVNGTATFDPLTATPDLNGHTGGISGFLNYYANGTLVTVGAQPTSTIFGTNYFHHWEIDGVAGPLRANNQTFVADADRTCAAIFEAPRLLNVTATLDGAPVAQTITCSPNDLLGNASVATPGPLAFLRDEPFALSAPIEINGQDVLHRFTVDGVETPSFRGTLSTSVAANAAIVAEYESVPCFESDIGQALGMGDDSLATGLALGFDFPLPGVSGTTTDAIDVCSNGFLWLVSGGTTSTDATPTGQEFEDLMPRIAPFWADLTFPGSADVYFRTLPGRAVITWHDARLQGGSLPFTVQCQLFANGTVRCYWSNSVPSTGASLVGVSDGGGAGYVATVNLGSTGLWTTSHPTVYDQYAGDFALQGIALAIVPHGVAGFQGHHLDCSAGNVLSYGTGCEPRTAFYDYDTGAAIGAVTLELTPNAQGGYDVVQGPGTSGYQGALGSSLGLGDDALATVNLPFAFPYPGNRGGSTAISVCSNGFLWLDANSTNGHDWLADVGSFLDQSARLAPMWIDLDPTSPIATGVIANVMSDRVVITWHNVPEYGSTVPLTVQCQLFDDGHVVIIRLDANATSANMIVGFSPGFGANDPGSTDLGTGLPLSTFGPGVARLQLAVAGAASPVIGSTLPLEVVEPTASGVLGLLAISLSQAQLELGFLGAPDCYLLGSSDVLEVFVPTGATTALAYGLPPQAAWIGAPLFLQAVSFLPGSNAFGAVFSNGLELTLGEL
ncbi:MAG TPA: hypothetical protein VFZ65_20185 [Planctomycetota bacterium]|nr:hypothetical protein [Planctomycetota bacterium]